MPQYNTTEDKIVRFNLFQKNLKKIDKLNTAEKAEDGTAVFGINEMSDLSTAEFESRYLGFVPPDESDDDRLLADVAEVEPYLGASTSVDWRGKLTTPLKYQDSCGSCW